MTSITKIRLSVETDGFRTIAEINNDRVDLKWNCRISRGGADTPVETCSIKADAIGKVIEAAAALIDIDIWAQMGKELDAEIGNRKLRLIQGDLT